MKRIFILFILGIIATLVAVSCSQKLEPPTGPKTDTLTVHDTVHDTVTVTDTLPPDTVIIVDTIRIPNDDGYSKIEFCSTIQGSTKSLNWLVSAAPGTYNLMFQAVTEKNQPKQSVSVTIDGVTTAWSVADESKLMLTRELGESAITVTSNTPPAYGHDITICLMIKRE